MTQPPLCQVGGGTGAPPPVLSGAHFSIAGGRHRAVLTAHAYECTALQIFTKNASTRKERNLTDRDILVFEEARQQTGTTVIASSLPRAATNCAFYALTPTLPGGEGDLGNRNSLARGMVTNPDARGGHNEA